MSKQQVAYLYVFDPRMNRIEQKKIEKVAGHFIKDGAMVINHGAPRPADGRMPVYDESFYSLRFLSAAYFTVEDEQ